MKQPLPNNPMGESEQPADDEGSFENFAGNTAFLRNILHPHSPEPNTGVHVPVWLSPKLAKQILAQHGHTGHAIPHRNINLNRLDK